MWKSLCPWRCGLCHAAGALAGLLHYILPLNALHYSSAHKPADRGLSYKYTLCIYFKKQVRRRGMSGSKVKSCKQTLAHHLTCNDTFICNVVLDLLPNEGLAPNVAFKCILARQCASLFATGVCYIHQLQTLRLITLRMVEKIKRQGKTGT